jgi:endonuclease/exonuclease/phosphatase family metal-dependent hydrolase
MSRDGLAMSASTLILRSIASLMPMPNTSAESGRLARLILASLIFVVGLQSMRFLFASLTWYLRDTLGIGVINLVPIALAPFVLAGLLPALSRWAGMRRTLWAGVAVLVLSRLLLQISSAPSLDFWASSIGTFAFVGLLPLVLGLGRSALVGGLLLGLAIDSAIKGLGLSLDVAYQPGWQPILAVVAISAGMVWALVNTPMVSVTGLSWRRGAILLSIGPFLFVEALVLQSQGWTSAVTGVSGPATQLRIALLNVAALYLAYRWQGKKWLFLFAVSMVGLSVVIAEGNAAIFNLVALMAVPLAGVAWAGLVPESDSDTPGSSGFYLVAGMTVFLILGLAYYLPLDMNLGFSQAMVRYVVGILVLISGVVGLANFPVDRAVDRHDWFFAAAAVLLSVTGFGIAATTEVVVAPGANSQVRFMTYNVHSAFNTDGVLDVESIARVVEDSEAEVIAFQEMPRGRLISANTDLMTLLKVRLGFEHVAYFGTTDPVWGNAVFSRFPITGFGTDYLPKVGTPMQRGYLGATISLGDREVLVISTHLQHVNDSSVHDDDPEADLLPVHSQQIDVILDSWGGQMPAVLMGDFNARPEWAQIARIEGAGWIDSWNEAGSGEGLTSGAADPMYRIDYIFHTTDMLALDAGVIQSTASDHFSVVADLTFG